MPLDSSSQGSAALLGPCWAYCYDQRNVSVRILLYFSPSGLRLCIRLKDHVNVLLHVLSRAVLRSAWVEPDSLVRAAMWEPLLTFLKGIVGLIIEKLPANMISILRLSSGVDN
jgi:hypothetical protein